MMRTVSAISVGLMALVGASVGAHAQLPSQPIKILYGFAPGSGGDLLSRMVAERLSVATGQSVVVENRTGASGKIALKALMASPADGTTLFIGPNGPMTIIPLYDGNAGYDPTTDFTPVTQLVTYEFALGVATSTPVKSVRELVDYVKANPGKGSYGTPGAGSSLHFLGLKLAETAGIDLRAVHYRGSVPAITDAMGGQVSMVFLPLVDTIEQHRSGAVRILATSAGERSSFVPEAPTFVEQGYDIAVTGWYGAFAPAKTPRPVIDALNKAMVEAVRSPEISAKLNAMGFHPAGTTPDGLAQIRDKEIEFWRPIVKASGFKAEE
jgi:tripartite-type tricarboxylate transporter receptor subunit TctC